MKTKEEIEDIDCQKLSRDHIQRRRVLPILRAYFEGRFKDFDPEMSDTDVIRFSEAKYKDRPFDDPQLVEKAEQVHHRFSYAYEIPDHVCSWYKEALKKSLQAA